MGESVTKKSIIDHNGQVRDTLFLVLDFRNKTKPVLTDQGPGLKASISDAAPRAARRLHQCYRPLTALHSCRFIMLIKNMNMTSLAPDPVLPPAVIHTCPWPWTLQFY